MGVANDITEATLRNLAQAHADEQTVLSLYIDLDPSQFATAPARATEIRSLLDRAHREIEAGERSHSERQSLRAACDRAGQILEEDGSRMRSARALSVFVCEPLGLARVLRLPHSVQSAVVVSDAPFIAPLAESGTRARVCVALVDERFARILLGSGEQLREAISFGDTVHGRHDQGGWSQARYQRSQHEDVDAHLRHTARVLGDLLRVSHYERLLVACTEPLWTRVLAELHPDVRALLHEQRLSLDVRVAGLQDVVQAAAPVLAAERRQREQEVLDQLRRRHGREGPERVAVGLREVLHALVERRVQTLVYEAGLSAPGAVCPACGWMDTDAQTCPADGRRLTRRANIVEDAIQAAVGQDAEVMPLRDRPDLGPLGGIAATLRF